MKHTIRTRLAALLCAAALLAGCCGLVQAASGQKVTVGAAEAAPGETCTVWISAEQFSSMTALSLMVTYDTNALAVVGTAKSSAMDVATVNTATAGFVQYAAASSDGVSGSCKLFSITFQVAEDADARDYSISVLVTQALGGSGDQAVSVSTSAGAVTVRENIVTDTVAFSAGVSAGTVQAGETVQVVIRASELLGMAAGQFSFTYDETMFSYEGLSLESGLLQGSYQYSVNSKSPGRVLLVYATSETAQAGRLMTLTLRALGNVSGSSRIEFAPLTLADADGTAIAWSGCAADVTVLNPGLEPEMPKVWLQPQDTPNILQPFYVDLYVSGSSGLAAADFTVTYDAGVLTCESVETVSSAGDTLEGVSVEINDSFTQGTVSCSMLCNGGVSQDTPLITLKLQLKKAVQTQTTLTTAVSLPVNDDLEAVELDCRTLSLEIGDPNYTVTFLNWDGTELSRQTVGYQEAAKAPEAERTDFTEAYHYVFSGWDQDFSSVTGSLTVMAQYTRQSHSLGGWMQDDGENHSKFCAGCAYKQSQSHDWGIWEPDSEADHTRTCQVCQGTGSQSHSWEEGVCGVCSQSTVSLTTENSQARLFVPGYGDNITVFVAGYDKNGQQLSLEMPDYQNSEAMTCAVDAGAVTVKAFLLDSSHRPIRPVLTYPAGE